MGKKFEVRKIKDTTRCQVTFSKRRTSLLRKVHEISVYYGVDIALLMFSPSGRISKYSNSERIEDVLHHYMNLPIEGRLGHIDNLQRKLEKIKLFGRFRDDIQRLQYLDKQIENLELQIKKRNLELQILEAGLRDYETFSGQDLSLHQLSWCEKNLNNSLQRIISKKNELFDHFLTSSEQPIIQQPSYHIQQDFNQTESKKQRAIPFLSRPNKNNLPPILESPATNQLLMQLDPWISPYSAKVRDHVLGATINQSNYTTVGNLGFSNNSLNTMNPSNLGFFDNSPDILNPSNMYDVLTSNPLATMASPGTMEQPLMVNQQPSLEFPNQINQNASDNNIINVTSSDAAQLSTQWQCNFNDSGTTTGLYRGKAPLSINNEIGTSHQSPNPNSTQFIKMVGRELGQHSLDCSNSIAIGSTNNGNMITGKNNRRNFNFNEIYAVDLSQVSNNTNPHMEVCHQNMIFQDNLPQEDNAELISKVKTSGLWEWEDLLFGDFNFQDL